MQYLIYWLDGDVRELPCAISPLYITGGVLFLIFLNLWYVGALIIHHDVHILLIFEKVPHVVVEDTSLGHLECWPLWDMDDKLIPVLTVVIH